ncbi:related to zinc-binding oxidoreductase [Cephalotrichum gorgonifer]|uniref:Related to zinc-binding oxidoreductase n=1 Tax=Cephalotrichum gorgonifer TaxID=2041049 RepID=A0AAE8N4U4_9PEZI|nr:related to zinc-binding oxidoreductase [Cephalotrichum gorgonifer]
MASPLPKTMRTILQTDKNSSKLTMKEVPLPTPTHPNDVLVKVAATSPCLGELWWARDFPDSVPVGKEPVPGQDLAGTVVAAPEGSAFKPGDEVFARIDASRPGAGREYALARESELALRPKSLDWAQTTATPLSALTAWQIVFVQGTLEAAGVFGDKEARKRNGEKRVLITGAGGSVGGFAVQFAAAAGAGAVVAVNSGSKAEFVKSLGATEVVDYTKVTVDAWAAEDPASREVDLIADCIGGSTMKNLWAALKDGGSFISIAMPPDMVKPEGYGKTPAKSVFFIVTSLGSQLAEISKLIDAGGIKPLVDSVFEFEQFQEAFDKVESRKTAGKVIIKVSV